VNGQSPRYDGYMNDESDPGHGQDRLGHPRGGREWVGRHRPTIVATQPDRDLSCDGSQGKGELSD
jgi:hypothetical protein